MALKHSVYDNDTHFSVNLNTRALNNESSSKSTLIQNDHNSERFTFEIPRYIEGHDMSKCDTVQVHYNNIDVQTKAESKGVYEVDDMQISPDDDNVVICSWLISMNATQFVGSLNFLLRFVCFDTDGTLSYAWNTAIYTNISISNGIYNGEFVAEEYADILNAWSTELKANQIVSLEQIQEADGDEGVNVWEATFGDGRKSTLNVRNGSRGPTGYIGSIETITGDPLHFFVGTQEEYNKLTDKQKDNLFAIISDDPAKDNILAAIKDLQNEIKSMKNGSVSISYAQTAGHALTATRADTAGTANKAKALEEGATVPLAEKAKADETGLTFDAYLHPSWNKNSMTGLPENRLAGSVVLPSAGLYHISMRSVSTSIASTNQVAYFIDFGVVRVFRDSMVQSTGHVKLSSVIDTADGGKQLTETCYRLGIGRPVEAGNHEAGYELVVRAFKETITTTYREYTEGIAARISIEREQEEITDHELVITRLDKAEIPAFRTTTSG